MIEARLAVVADVPALVALMREFYAESGFPLDEAWASAAFRTLLDDPSLGAVWLLVVDGTPAGHAVLSVRFAMEFGGLTGYIDDLFVRPPFRRRGAARAGLEALIAECRRRRCRSLQVEVDPDNASANGLYRSLGLAPLGDNRLQLRVELR